MSELATMTLTLSTRYERATVAGAGAGAVGICGGAEATAKGPLARTKPGERNSSQTTAATCSK